MLALNLPEIVQNTDPILKQVYSDSKLRKRKSVEKAEEIRADILTMKVYIDKKHMKTIRRGSKSNSEN